MPGKHITRQCGSCLVDLQREAYDSDYQFYRVDATKRRCNQCASTRRCSSCLVDLQREAYDSEYQFYRVDAAKRRCSQCACVAAKRKSDNAFEQPPDAKKVTRGIWTCVSCKKSFPKELFSIWLAPRKTKVKDKTCRCNYCMQAEGESHTRIAGDTLSQVTKISRRS